MTVELAGRQSNYEPMSPATHTVLIIRWSTWNRQRAIDRAVILVENGLQLAKLEWN